MKANGRMIREMDMGLLDSLVENSKEKSMMVSGKMVNATEKELIIFLMERVLWERGKMAILLKKK